MKSAELRGDRSELPSEFTKPPDMPFFIPNDEEQGVYRFILASAKRARQLQAGARPSISTTSRKPTRIAMEEIRLGAVEVELPEIEDDEENEASRLLDQPVRDALPPSIAAAAFIDDEEEEDEEDLDDLDDDDDDEDSDEIDDDEIDEIEVIDDEEEADDLDDDEGEEDVEEEKED